VEDRRGGDVDALGDLRVPVPEQLQAQQPAGGPVAGDAHGDAVAAGIVGLVVVGLGLDGDGVEPGGGRLVVAQPGPSGGLVEDLHDLGAEAARELPAPAQGVLPGDAALLVRGRAEREVSVAEQPVVCGDAVPGSEDVWQAGAHLPVHGHRALRAEAGAGGSGQPGVGADAHHDQDHVHGAGHGMPVLAAGGNGQPGDAPGGRAGDRGDGGAGEHLDAVPGELVAHELCEVNVSATWPFPEQAVGQLARAAVAVISPWDLPLRSRALGHASAGPRQLSGAQAVR
jgi:hypothetical protein